MSPRPASFPVLRFLLSLAFVFSLFVALPASPQPGGGAGGAANARLVHEPDSDPSAPAVPVPAVSSVLGAPDILLEEEFVLESRMRYLSYGAITRHAFALETPPVGGGKIELVAEGDFGSSSKTATAGAEGVTLGSAGGTGSGCLIAEGDFPLAPDVLSSLAADGEVNVTVSNSAQVDVACPVNAHTVRLVYRTLLEGLDFGSIFVGHPVALSFLVSNAGSDPLVVAAVESDDPAFLVSPSAFTVDPGGSEEVFVGFVPAAAGARSATLTITSDDPDTPAATLDLDGVGLDPPVVSVEPASLSSALFTGDEETQLLTLSNSGASPLDFELSVIGRRSGARACDVETLLVTSYSEGSLLEVDVQTGAVRTITGGLAGPAGISVDRAGEKAYFTESTGGSLSKVDLATGERVSVSTGLSIPLALDLSSDDATAYVTEGGSSILSAIDLASGSVSTIATGLVVPNGVALDPGETTAYVTEDGGASRLSAVDLATGSVRTVATGLQVPVGLVLDPSGTHAYVAESSSRISRVDLSSGSISTVAYLGGLVGGLALDPGGDILYFTESQFCPPCSPTGFGAGRVAKVDIASGTVTTIASGIRASAVAFALPRGCRFLTADPVSGSVPPFDEQSIQIRFSAAGLETGTYEADILIETNDPSHAQLTVPASLTVNGVPILVLEPDPPVLEFGQVFVGQAARLSFSAVNAGGDLLTVSSLAADRPEYSVSPSSISLHLGEEQEVTVDFMPVTTGPHDAALTILSNDPDRPSVVVPISGAGVEPPIVGAEPAALESTLFSGQRGTRVLTLANTGGSDLIFTLLQATPGSPAIGLDPASGTVPPGGSIDVGVTFETLGLPAGTYENQILIRSNDPLTPELPVPVRLTVVAAPDLRILGDEVRLQSIESYSTIGASTTHSFTGVESPGGGATLRVLAEGNYGGPGDYATLNVEGLVGFVVGVGQDCVPISRILAVTASELAAIAADGVVDVVVQNSPSVDVSCAVNRHTVELVYHGPADRLDFGEVFLGFPRTRLFRISNEGTEPLLASITSPFPDYTFSPASVSLPPGASDRITVTFAPSSQGEQPGALVIDSNDPVEPRATLGLTAVGLVPPVVGHEPAALTGIALPGGTDVETLTVTNTGESDLDFTLAASGASFLGFAPAAGSVPAGGSLGIDVTFTAGALAPGVRTGAIVLSSNDPVAPTVSVPVTFLVRGTPALRIQGGGGTAQLESMKAFSVRTTNHHLAPAPLSQGTGRLEIVVRGDFAGTKSATVTAEGIPIGLAGEAPGTGCVEVSKVFTLSESTLSTLTSDGAVDVTVTNSVGVLAEDCPVNTHTVELTYDRAGAAPIDFGEALVGATETRSLVIESIGTDILEVTLASGMPEFTASPASLSIFPGNSESVTMAFTPTSVGPFSTALVVSSNDPWRPSITVDLSGVGMPAPAAVVEPTSFELALPPLGTAIRHLEISNTGQSDLSWEIQMAAPGASGGAMGPAPAWLAVSPGAGAVPPGGSVDVAVVIDAGLAPEGDSTAIVSVLSNDPVRGRVDATVLLHAGYTDLDYVNVEPNTLNPSANGKTVRGWLQLPVHLDPRDVLIPTVSIEGRVFASAGQVTIGDENGDGVDDLVVKFDRAALEAILPEGQSITVALTGEVRDKAWFRGTDSIRAIRPRLTHPHGGEYLAMGAGVTVAWEPPEWQGAVTYTLLLSRDGGEVWESLASGLTGLSYEWTPSGAPTDRALLRVIASDSQEVIGYDTSDAGFFIAEALHPPNPVTGLEAVIDAGDLVLAWPAPPADLLHGPALLYRVMEAESPAGPWVELDVSTSTSLRVAGGGLGPGVAFYKVAAVNTAGEAEEHP